LSFEEHPELSVIVPVYNEEANIAPFLRALATQQGVRMELVFSDGGSQDRSIVAMGECRKGLPFPLRVIEGARGRAGQLNRGAAAALAPMLLFLHIDSHFPDPLALRKALDALEAANRGATRKVAGHFALEFHFEGPPPLPYRFYGAKATLERRGCTHGDQGFLIGADFFHRVGPFNTTLPLMEDTFLAERIRDTGRWLLLPARIQTSPRRFLSEGLLPRQTLNAMLTNLADLGRLDLIEELKGCYRSQHAAQRLSLAPYFDHIRSWIAALPSEERRRFWYDTGSYVRGNAWQIAFFLDLLMGGVPVGRGGRMLALHDRFLVRMLDNALMNWVAAALVWVWFKAVTLRVSKAEYERGEVKKGE
jgi:rSAM/selenodomain-associated transferase 2